jgi:antitoxin VapB
VSDEINVKTERLVELLKREHLGGVFLNAQHNFAWITCGSSNGVDLSRENGVASIFVRRDGKRFLIANNIELPRMLAEEISPDLFDPVEFTWQDEKADGLLAVKKAEALVEGEVAADLFFSDSVPNLESKIAPLRYELTEKEVDRFRSLGHDAAEAISQTIRAINPGVSEIEIAAEMRRQLSMKNINSVVTLVATDERIAKYRHPVPTESKWIKTLLLVTCAKRGGLIVSLSRMVCVGDVTNKLKEKTEAAAFVNASLWNATRPGSTGAELYKVAAHAYATVGYANEINLHHQGGAAGYKTREWVAHPKSIEVVKQNQAFAWNPSITGTKIEDTIIVTENGIENITSSDDEPQIETEIDGQVYRSPGVITI